MISEESLAKFKKLYKKEFKKDLSDQDALRQATTLRRMIELIYKPMTIDDYKRLKKRRGELWKSYPQTS